MANIVKLSTGDYVSLSISNSKDSTICLDKRFPKCLTVADLKGKLELLTAGNPATMRLELYGKENNIVAKLDNDSAPLGSYPVEDGMRLHVIDKFVLRSDMEDFSNVEKFELSLEEYAKREDTLRAYLARNRLGKYNEEEMKKREEEKRKEREADEAAAKAAKVGDRCEVRVPGQPTRRATVMYIGEVEFKPGWWIGVKYDEPQGKNDGSVDGKRYFDCSPKYGGFVRPGYVKIGDFPEEASELDEI